MSIEITKRPYAKVFSGNPVHYELHSTQAESDASIYFEIKLMFKTPGGTYAALNEPLEYYPVNGYAEIDVKDILHSVLEYGVPPFHTDETIIYQAPKQTGFFYLQYREITTTNPEPSWDTSELTYERFVIKGGLNYFQYRGNNYWLNYYDLRKPFLTWQMNGRLAASNERMYLAWLGDYTTAYPVLKAIAYYTDGSASAVQNFAFPAMGTFPKDFVYFLPVGCDQLGLNALDPTRQIYYWTVQVQGSEGASELFKYELDNRNDYNQTTLHYRNSLGGLDSVRVRGVIEQDLNYDYLEQETTTTPDYFSGAAVQSQRKVTDSTEQLIYKGDIGHLRKEEQDRLRDAFLQREVYWEVLKKWFPIIISTKSNKLRTSQDQRFTLPIEWQMAYIGGEYYTPKSVDLGDGVFTSNVCTAFISPMTVDRDTTTGFPDSWGFFLGENDPDGIVVNLEYRVVKDSDGSVLIDWTPGDWGLPSLPLGRIPNDTGTYTVQARAICSNGVYGKTTSTRIDTTTGAPGGGGSGGTGGTGSSYIDNQTSSSVDWSVDIDSSAQTDSGNAGAYNAQPFSITVSPVSDVYVLVTITGISPSMVTIESGGVTYNAISVLGGTWTFNHVTIVDGIRITLY